ncbi:Uncharacterised protein [Candidatus Burarchaeum australiense]|nr:Uncharacterised protein [Candidatus Burarchaeum australiense]
MHYDYIPQTRADAGYFKKLVESNFSNTKIVVMG